MRVTIIMSVLAAMLCSCSPVEKKEAPKSGPVATVGTAGKAAIEAAMSAEAIPVCTAIRQALVMQLMEDGGSFAKSYNGPAAKLPMVNESQLNGRFFSASDYVVSKAAAGSRTYEITCTGSKGSAKGITVVFTADGGIHRKYQP